MEVFAEFNEHQQRSPEIQLWCEVLYRAGLDAERKSLRNYRRAPRKKDAESAVRFFMSVHFVTVARLIGLDPDIARNRFVPLAIQREYMATLARPIRAVVPTLNQEMNGVNANV